MVVVEGEEEGSARQVSNGGGVYRGWVDAVVAGFRASVPGFADAEANLGVAVQERGLESHGHSARGRQAVQVETSVVEGDGDICNRGSQKKSSQVGRWWWRWK